MTQTKAMNRMIYISILILCFQVLSFRSALAQTNPKLYKLYVNLENAPFDSLFLQDYKVGKNVFIVGKKINKYRWEIDIPDDIVRNSENMVLLSSRYNAKGNSKEMIRFVSKRFDTKTIIANVGVEGESNSIYGKYLDSTVFPNEQIIVKNNNKDSSIIGNLVCRDFNLTIKDKNSDIAVRAEDPLFSWFQNMNGDIKSYQEYLESYTAISKRHPNSRFLMSNLSKMLDRYKSKEDIEKIFSILSDRHKNNVWAARIKRFLYESKQFDNTSLSTGYTDSYENIVADFSKYNLVVFSASWCKPCIEEIPIFKKILSDLGKNLTLTFVSIDEFKDIDSFRKIINAQNIKCRILFSYKNSEKIKDKYFVQAIPHTILILPNNEMQKIDVRKEIDRLKLYSIINSNSN